MNLHRVPTIWPLLLIVTLAFGTSVPGQGLITGSTAANAEISERIPLDQLVLADLIGGRTLKAKFVSLDGKTNSMTIDVPGIESEIDLSSGSGSLVADLQIIKIGLEGDPSAAQNTVYVEAALGSIEFTLALDFEPGTAAITGSTAMSKLKPTPYKLTLRNKESGETKEFSGVAGVDDTGLRYAALSDPLVYDTITKIRADAQTQGMSIETTSEIDSSHELMISDFDADTLDVSAAYRDFQGTATVNSAYVNQTIPIDPEGLVGVRNTFRISRSGIVSDVQAKGRSGVFLPEFPVETYTPGIKWSEETSMPIMVGPEGRMNSRVQIEYHAYEGESLRGCSTVRVDLSGEWQGDLDLDVQQGSAQMNGSGTITGKALFCPSSGAFIRYALDISGDMVQIMNAGGHRMQTNMKITVNQESRLRE